MKPDPKRILSLILTVFATVFVVLACTDNSAPGFKAPPFSDDDQNVVAWDALRDDLRDALYIKDENQVLKITQEMIQRLGPDVGVPEVAPRYYLPLERDMPELDKVVQLWAEIESHVQQDLVWLLIPDGDPQKMETGLRQACRPIIAFTTISEVWPDEQAGYIQLVRDGTEYVLMLQRENGLFPFPDLRGRNHQFGPMVEKLLRQYPDALVDGWILNDGGYGDLQYDNGICGIAMLKAYQLTQEKAYLDAARRASDWARSQPLSTNWNYNAFSVWLLARFAQVSGEYQYLEAAYERFRLGIRPGQLPDGHWFDPHNARLVYHSIITRGILELDQALPPSDPRQGEVRESLTKALDYAAAEIITHGASSVSVTTEVFSRALRDISYKTEWEIALNINVNASLMILKDPQAPYIGLYLADYLAYRLLG